MTRCQTLVAVEVEVERKVVGVDQLELLAPEACSGHGPFERVAALRRAVDADDDPTGH
jgi:hypothetical protein